MNRLSTLLLIGLAGILASCGTTISSTNQPGTHDVYTLVVTPDRLTLNAGDWSSPLTATVDLSNENSAPRPIAPQPTIKFYSSDPRVSVSPSGEVCGGLWDSKYLTCKPVVHGLCSSLDPNTGACIPDPLAGQLDIPTGYVTITAYNTTHSVTGTTQVSIHQRAASIKLSAPAWTAGTKCISQNSQIKYQATAQDANGKPIGNIFDNDYTWVIGDSSVAAASTYGYVVARNPGVTSVYAKLNGTTSAPLAFATCPPAAIVFASSAYTKGTPVPPFSTADLNLIKGGQQYLTATGVDSNGNALPLVDLNGNPLNTLPLSFITSDTLAGSFGSVLALTGKLTANTSGRFSVMAACAPGKCNNSVPDFVSPAGEVITAKDAGFGYPIYSNSIGVTVQGTSGSTVLVTGKTFSDGTTPAHRLLAYDSESLAVLHTVAIANIPNSLVVSPNGQKAYLGSSDGLVVVDLTSYQSAIQTFPVVGGNTNPPDVVTGTVIGVSPDSRYVVVSDTSDPNPANNLVFLIDTTGTRSAVRYTNLGRINAVTFAADGSNFWIAGDSGVYTYSADTFVPISAYYPPAANLSTHVKALTWMPDGLSFFASGDQLVNYSTCDDRTNVNQPSPNLTTVVTGGLSTTTIGGVPHLLGLSAGQWFDYSLTTSAQANPTPTEGNVCQATVAINAPATAASTLQCAANHISFSPTQDANGNLSLPREFVTGVDPACTSPEAFIHGYDVNSQQEIKISTTNPVVPLSGGALNDGRKLYFGTYDSASQTALLHRINFDPTAGPVGEDVVTAVVNVVGANGKPILDPVTGLPETQTITTIPAPVQIVPSFVAVVPK